jgi:xanthine dehydrogenase accessory factor
MYMSSSVHQLLSHSKLDWLSACQSLQQHGVAYCIATVVAEVGSLPRGTGSKMVITQTHQSDTLGGGQLELEVVRLAREGLSARLHDGGLSAVTLERFALAADLGQCCGGAAQVMFEFVNTQLPHVVVFGAGHVGHALSMIVKELPCHLLVVDNRRDWLERLSSQGIATLYQETPADAIDSIAAHSLLVVMTHEHGLDYEITRRALERQCFPFIGLIGSATKKQRFEFRLKEALGDESLLNQLTCPIGHPDIQGKLPMQVAVSIAAQLMAHFDASNGQLGLQHKAAAEQWDKTNQLRQSAIEINDK